MSHSLYGARQFQPVTRSRPPRAPAATFVSNCVTESFDGGSYPIGPDQSWEFGHLSAYLPSTGSPTSGFVNDDGTDATKRTVRVVGDRASVRAMDDANLPGGNVWWRTMGFGVCDTELSGSDMRVSATISGATIPSPYNPEWILSVRNFDDPDNDLASGYSGGYRVYFMPFYIFVECSYVSSVVSPGILTAFSIIDTSTLNPSFAWEPSDGDEISVEITGTDTATVLTCSINGTPGLVADSETDFREGGGFAGLLFDDDPMSDLPNGSKAGFGFFVDAGNFGQSPTRSAWDRGNDDVVTLDNWESCPA